MQTSLYTEIANLVMAYDTENGGGLWRLMLKFGCPMRFTNMIRQLHDGIIAQTIDNGALLETSEVASRMDQGCVSVLILLNLLFCVMLANVYHEELSGVNVDYRVEGQFVSTRQMKASTQTSIATVHELVFVDDYALSVTAAAVVQGSIGIRYASVYKVVCLGSTFKQHPNRR
nr:unnamed protein product [Spirometra erinaceieuropaei]